MTIPSLPSIPCPRCQRPKPDGAGPCDPCKLEIERIEQQLMEINQLIETGDLTQALHNLGEMVVEVPAEFLADCYAIRGYVHLKKMDFSRSEDDCSESIELNWEQPQTYAWRGIARAEQNKWRQAFDDLDHAYLRGGAKQDYYLNLMQSLLGKARDYFRLKIQQTPDAPELFFERGWVYLRTGKFAKAFQDLDRALQLAPTHPWAALAMAEWITSKPLAQGNYEVVSLCQLAMTGCRECQQRSLKIQAQYYLNLADIVQAKICLRQLADWVSQQPKEIVECAQFLRKLGDPLTAIDLLNRLLEKNKNHSLALLERGGNYSDIRNYPLALQDYNLFLDQYPKHVTGLVHRGTIYLKMHKAAKSLTDLNTALDLEPHHVEANLRLAEAHLELQDFDMALSHCRQAVERDNQRAECYAVMAAIFSRLCDYTNAIEEYSRSIQLADQQPSAAQYRFLRGIAFYQQENFEKATQDFQSATKQRPYHAGGWIWLAASQARSEEWAEAIVSLQQAIEVNPTLALQYRSLGEPVAEKAIRHYQRQEQRGNTKPALYLSRAVAHQFLHQHEQAIHDLTKALQLKPQSPAILLRRGQAFTQLGDINAALSDFTFVLNREPRNHRAFFQRANAYIADAQWELAKQDIQQAVKIAPDHPGYHLLLGELYNRLGQPANAMACYDLAILQNSTNYRAYHQRAKLHLQQNEYVLAIRDLSHALELNPGDAGLLVQRGEVHLKANHPVTALEDFERALTVDERIAAAYAGRAEVLLIQHRYEYALIWLTKAMHRFTEPVDLAQVLLARGKVFLQMGRGALATNDFNWVVSSIGEDHPCSLSARFQRAIAKVQLQLYDAAAKDLHKLLRLQPDFQPAVDGLQWLRDRQLAMPDCFYPPANPSRPTRPPVARTGVTLSHGFVDRMVNQPPFDNWIIRTDNHSEFGPISLETLTLWASQGRLVNGMKLLRADWSKWKRIEKIFPEITPLESLPGLIEEFPQLDLKPTSKLKQID